MMKCGESPRRKLSWPVILVCAVGLLIVIAWGTKDRTNTPASEVFMRYFFQDVPESVTNIRISQPGKFFGRRYVLRFSINNEDFTQIKKSRPFVKLWNLEYESKMLSWRWDPGYENEFGFRVPGHGESLSPYGSSRGPRWFKPEKWRNPEAYGFCKKGDLENFELLKSRVPPRGHTTLLILIYNEKEGEAYLVAMDYSH